MTTTSSSQSADVLPTPDSGVGNIQATRPPQDVRHQGPFNDGVKFAQDLSFMTDDDWDRLYKKGRYHGQV